MKAAVINKYGGPEVFEITDVPKPTIEKPTDVLFKVKYSSINPVDWKTRKGNLKYILGSHFPIVLGYDASGIVEEVGSAVTKFKPGDEVYVRLDRKYGRALAEYAVGSETAFAIKPKEISFAEAAAIPLAALTALQGLRDKGKIIQGSNVLIIGASSGVGHMAVQLAHNYGAKVTAICSSRHKELIDRLSPLEWIDYEKSDFKKSGKKWDIVYDIIGHETYLSTKHLLKSGGIFITTLPRPKVLAHKFLALFSIGKKARTLLMKPIGTDIDIISDFIKKGKFFVQIDSEFSLDDISKAHAHSQSGKAEGKIVIKIG